MSDTRHELQAPTCDDAAIWRIWLSAFYAPSLAVADELGIFRALADAPCDANELAGQLRIELRAAESLLALMSALDLLVLADGRYRLTPVARHFLLPESAYYWGPMLRRIREAPLDCTKLIEALRRGAADSEGRLTKVWESSEPPAEVLRGFTRAMHAHSLALAMRVVPSFGLDGAARWLDAAGGSGAFSIVASMLHPSLRCTVLDLPVVCEVAREYAARFGLEQHIQTVPLDMFAGPWPGDFDRVFFNDILHDWDDERCRVLVERAREALAPDGRVLVHEMLLSDTKDGPLHAAAYSMMMVFATRGRQRSARELVELLAAAGLAEIRVTPTWGGYALVEGTARRPQRP